ncbi:MAG: OmpA family protein [Longimicrobiales bacterium]
MLNLRSIIIALTVAVVFVACGSEPPPPPPAPVGPTEAELAQMRADSIRAAREAEQRAEQQRREAEAAAAERATAAARATLEEMVFFDYDESRLTPETERLLRAKMEILRNNPAVQLRMEGHADERGTSEYNIALGNERAESVIQFLTNFGIDGGRFTPVSYGEERPLSQSSDEATWARNRRVEFVITAGGNAISG